MPRWSVRRTETVVRPLLLFPLALAAVLVAAHSSGDGAVSALALADQAVPVTADGPEVTLEGAKPIRALVRGGRLEYPSTLGAGMDLVREVHGPSGLEDWIRLPRPPKEPRVRYRIALGKLAGLRLVHRTLEALDAEGTPRVRMHPPWIRDAFGKTWPVRVSLLDCAVDVDPRPPWGRPVTMPGRSVCTMELAWSLADSGYPALLDPEWSRASDLMVGRSLHSATRLVDGRVLLVGGYSEALQTDLTSAELYDPRTRTFATTGSAAVPRRAHAATLLDDGRVVILGGDSGVGTPAVLSAVERYDVGTGRFTTLPSLTIPRSHHTASKLQDGRILIAGSIAYANNGLASAAAEICEQDGSACRAIPPMNEPRSSHAASPLPDGRILISGGGGSIFNNESSLHATTTVFDPKSEAWSLGPPMPSARFDHVALLLSDGTTLIVGGALAPQGERTTDEVLALAPGGTRFTVAGRLGLPRWLHTATALPSGRVLVVGTGAPFYQPSTIGAQELFDVAGQSASFLPNLEPLLWHSQTLLMDGTVLLAGGAGAAQKHANIYTPPAPSVPPVPSGSAPPVASVPPTDAGPSPTASAPPPSAEASPVGLYSCTVRVPAQSGNAPDGSRTSAFLLVVVLALVARRSASR